MQLKNNLSFLCLALAIFGVLAIVEAKEGGGKGKGGGGGRMMNMMNMMNKTCKGEAFQTKTEADMKASKETWVKCAKEFPSSKNKTAASGGSTTTAASAGAEAEGGDKLKKVGKKVRGWMAKKINMCARVCVWKSEKVLGEDGKYNAAGAEARIKASFPTAVQADMKKATDECAKTHGASFSMDNNCEGYGKFSWCQMKKMMEVCEWGKGKGKGKKGGKGGKATTEATDAEE